MPTKDRGPGDFRPRHFFLNEQHELASQPPESGGGWSKFEPVDWRQKASSLREAFDRAVSPPGESTDPSSTSHRFLLTAPAALVKVSDSKKARESGGRVPFTPSFGGKQASVLAKLGLDLVAVDEHGTATVHVAAQRVPQLQSKLAELEGASRREQERWIHVGSFLPLDWRQRVDKAWLDSLPDDDPSEVHLRFQPILPRVEVQAVLEALRRGLLPREQLIRVGRDFSGRYWCIARLRRRQIRRVAEKFSSLQSLHPRLSTPIAGAATRRGAPRPKRDAAPLDVSTLPTVGMLDTGVPPGHPILGPYIRNRWVDPALASELSVRGDHGSTVASALVFGRVLFDDQAEPGDPPPPTCRVFDILGGWARGDGEIPDEMMSPAIDGVLATAADVRVFNLSLQARPLATMRPKEREEKLRSLQDLDNQAYARDVLLVFAAGNSPRGLVPDPPYPKHLDNEAWELGLLASTFNGVVVGSHVDPVSPRGLVQVAGAPSPFTLVGPGHLDAPVPGFGAPGGDLKDDYTAASRSGLWVFNASGQWEDCIGTSFAAPLVAREASFAFQELAKYCADGPPFAATVRAWLHVVARREELKGPYEKLARRTLGRGYPSADRIRLPDARRAVFVWQTILPSPGTTARVAVPVPREWLAEASTPRLRLVVAWLTPVNAALTDTWACRRVSAQLKTSTSLGAGALPRMSGGAVGAYPVSDRVYDLRRERLDELGQAPEGDEWGLDVSYEELGPPPAGMTFAPQQKVGVVIELWDEDEEPASPQAALQALKIAPMTRLSILQTPVQVPVVIR